MGCRCFDIARCQRDLSAMGGVVSPNVNTASSCSAQISQSMRLAAQGVGDAVSTATI
ncbi:MAG: hypothetical protein LBD12_05110 [Clostridiales Family XIII bacterium]|jgi:hypothetical protein|nr:hypothetical protein [Clostridiales Family XIII bacterium]